MADVTVQPLRPIGGGTAQPDQQDAPVQPTTSTAGVLTVGFSATWGTWVDTAVSTTSDNVCSYLQVLAGATKTQPA